MSKYDHRLPKETETRIYYYMYKCKKPSPIHGLRSFRHMRKRRQRAEQFINERRR